MSTATQTRTNQAPPATNGSGAIDESKLLELMLDLSLTEQVKQITAALDKREHEIEFLLPDFMKGQGKRLIRRARLTFAGSERLQECTPQSFVKCVLHGAEMGFAIDGRLCHAVPYKKSWQDKDKRWQNQYEAQCQVDYKGMIAHAKRLGLIQDCWARLVREKDHFKFMERNGVVDYEYAYTMDQQPGEILGAFAVATHKDGWTRFEWMSLGEIHQIRARSKSWNTSGDFKGPWQSDPGEMSKKTPIKRLLKTMTDDAGLIRMLEIDDSDTDLSINPTDTSERPSVDQSILQQIISTVGAAKVDQGNGGDSEGPRKRPQEETPTPTDGNRNVKEHVAKTDNKDASGKQATSQQQPPDTLSAFAQYRAQLEACETEKQCRNRYDGWFGPDSTVEFTPEQDKEAVVMRDAMIEHIRKTNPQTERMQLLHEKISSYKQPGRLTALAGEIDNDPSFIAEHKQTAHRWITERLQIIQGDQA